MKFLIAFVCLNLLTLLPCRAGDAAVGVLEEKVARLAAQVEDVQVRQQQQQKDIEKIQSDLTELRRAAGAGVAAADLRALEDRIQAVDNARKSDRQAIVDQLAKELAALSSGKAPVATGGKEHVVAKGETLSSIAKSYGVTVADLRKANNLAGSDIKIGQKLAIPK